MKTEQEIMEKIKELNAILFSNSPMPTPLTEAVWDEFNAGKKYLLWVLDEMGEKV